MQDADTTRDIARAASPANAGTLSFVMELNDYRQQHAGHLLRSAGAMEWYMRGNGDELKACGAVLKIAGRWYVHASRFDEAILRIGQQQAQKVRTLKIVGSAARNAASA